MRHPWWLGALMLCGIVAAQAQPTRFPDGGAGFLFHTQAATFLDEEGPRTELYVSVPLTSLHFEQTASGVAARARITAIFYDDDERQITGDDWNYHDIPGSLRRELNEGRSLTRRYSFRLPPGKTVAKVRVEEPDKGISSERRLEFEVPRFDRPLTISDLVFGVCDDMVRFAPSDTYVGPLLPHPSRAYGDRTPAICVYAELYDRRGGEGPFEVRYRVRNAGGRTVEDTTLFVSDRVVVLHPRFTGLRLGRYELQVEARRDGKRTERKEAFIVDESRISFIEDSEKLRTVLEYVATNEERRRLAFAPDDSLSAVWKAFWERRDPTPETRRNEAMIEFLKRVEYATRAFGVLEPGWRSDRGRVYIRLGPPDEIDRITNDSFRPPTEIWYYYSRNQTYVFQDTEGFGRYRLVVAPR